MKILNAAKLRFIKMADSVKTKAVGKVPMKVCMMGPRAVGKTTILTAIFNDTQENLGVTTNLMLRAEGDTHAELIKRKHYLDAIFSNRIQITDKPSAGLAATSTVNTFDFSFGLKGKEPRIDLEVKDFPGEYVLERPRVVTQFIEESAAVIIAVDTPHLMEEDGAFCEIKNRGSIITDFFRNQPINGEKLILIVPLKCERYFYSNRMSEVLSRVEAKYSDLILLFKSRGDIACAVTPILTLGGVEFDSFKRDSSQGIAVLHNGYPQEAIYRFREKDARYAPSFCVQPLYYTLSFLSAQYSRAKKKRRFIDRILSSFYNLFESDEELFDEILKMEKNRKTDLPGYSVECGANLFIYCK